MLLPKNALINEKLSFCVIPQHWCKTTFSQNYLALFSKIKLPLFGMQDREFSYNEPSLKLKSLELPRA